MKHKNMNLQSNFLGSLWILKRFDMNYSFDFYEALCKRNAKPILEKSTVGGSLLHKMLSPW